jgi:hypothetical protein
MNLTEHLSDVMDAYAKALTFLLQTVRPLKKYLVRVKVHGNTVTSLVYWFAVEWGGCEYYVKIYRKWGPEKRLHPVVGLSHVADCGGRLVYYPSIDADGKTPPKRYLEEALMVWKYKSASKGATAYHLVMPPVPTKSQALKTMLKYDDNRHLKFAHTPRKVDYFDFAVLRVSSPPTWREEVLYWKFVDEPMANLHKLLRCVFWTCVSQKQKR